MPPRKSNVSQISISAAEEGPNAASTQATGKDTPAKDNAATGTNIEDLNLPKSIVTRLAKGVLPPNTQIQGNAMLAMTKSATVFASYLASVANEHALTQSRKTVTAEHVLSALSEIEFDAFRPRLEAELAEYNNMQSRKRTALKERKQMERKEKSVAEGGEEEEDRDNGHEGEVEGDDETLPDDEMERSGMGEPRAKKARLDGNVRMRDVGGEEEETREDDEEQEEEADADETEEEEQNEPRDEEEEDGDEGHDAEEVEEKDEALDNGDDSD